MLLGLLDIYQLHIGKDEAVHGLRVLGIALVGAAQIIESPHAVAFLAKDGTQILEGHGIPGISKLEAAVQEISSFIELAEVHVAEAQVVDEVDIFGILAEELLQVDTGLVELTGGWICLPGARIVAIYRLDRLRDCLKALQREPDSRRNGREIYIPPKLFIINNYNR
jgi:hypothetical protein